MDPAIVDRLRCPVCDRALAAVPGALRCEVGHAFDVARQGYVNLVAGRAALPGDDARMVAARADVLAAGHYAPLAAAIADLAAEAPGDGLAVEVGAGTAYHLACVLERQPERRGLALDASRYAARRAARAHPRLGAVVADATRRWPVADGSAAILLDVFAPRNGAEFRRVLRPDGILVVVTPAPDHLVELRAVLGLLDVDPEKARRLSAALDPHFRRGVAARQAWPLRLGREDVGRAVAMGPSARHADPADLAGRLAALPDRITVTAAFQVEVCRPR